MANPETELLLRPLADNRVYHAESVDGLKHLPSPSDVVAWHSESKRVLVVTRLSNRTQRRRAQDLSLIVQRDIPFSGIAHHVDEALDERDLHIFIGAESVRLVLISLLKGGSTSGAARGHSRTHNKQTRLLVILLCGLLARFGSVIGSAAKDGFAYYLHPPQAISECRQTSMVGSLHFPN